jgi:hypothetical protein
MNRARINCIRLALIIALVSSCSLPKGKADAERGVELFHSQLNAEQYSEIYAEADEGFRSSAPPDTFYDTLRLVHQKMGYALQANQKAYFFTTSTGGNFVTLNYETHFANGDAQERFQWTVVGGRALLLRYDINSPALLQQQK